MGPPQVAPIRDASAEFAFCPGVTCPLPDPSVLVRVCPEFEMYDQEEQVQRSPDDRRAARAGGRGGDRGGWTPSVIGRRRVNAGSSVSRILLLSVVWAVATTLGGPMRGKGRSPKRRPREGRPGVQRPASTVVRARTNPAR